MKEIEAIQSDLLEGLAKEVDAGNIENALDIALTCYLLSKRFGSAEERLATPKIILTVLATCWQGRDKKVADLECSFCGRSGESVKLGASPKAYICDWCVDVFAGHFKNESNCGTADSQGEDQTST